VALDEKDVRRPPKPPLASGLGLLKGLGVTMKHLLQPSITQQYPQERPDLPARTRGVIALKEANCTVCYKCARECPDWCIYIDAHKETHEPAAGGRGRSAKILDRFAIDFSLCMYCGICVEVCPFDALFWSPEFEYATYDIVEMTHEKERLEGWTYTVLPPPALEDGATPPSEPALVAPELAALAAPPAPVAVAPVAAVVAPTATGATGAGAGGSATLEAAPSTPAVVADSPGVATVATAPRERKEVSLDQATFDRVLAELLEKGTARRVAEGQARRAAMIAARKKAEGE
jgi:NADH-quinone oxidoreductase subunit I